MLSIWDEPPAPNPPKRVWRDWVLVGALVSLAVLEVLVRPDVTWRPVAFILAVVLAVSLLWRRTHPLAVIVVVFGLLMVASVLAPYDPNNPFGLDSMAFVLLLPYALGRWASGRDMVLGLGFTLAAFGLQELVHRNLGEFLMGIPFLLAPGIVGLAVRYWSSSRAREIDQVKLREREQLARELHDTVAHHVSAMVIQAQAGRVLAEARPESAVAALQTIESEGTLALAEMRDMVGALRDGQGAELAPQLGIADVESLAGSLRGTVRIGVAVSGDVDGLRPAVGSAIFRIAQESITNAVRHARHASSVEVRIVGKDDEVELTVSDDGEPSVGGRSSFGYGIIGMKERAALLGGTLEAGPDPKGGWVVHAVLPRVGAAR